MKAARVLALSAASLLFGATPGVAQSALETAISHLKYREIGPALMGGRIADLDVVEAKPQIFYLGTATGGLWKTENHGTSWTPLFDDQPTSSIGDVTLHQANPNLVWVGTGEPQNRQSSPWGNGVYKSTDGGNTWLHMGLEATKHIARILIHPRNPDIVHVAAMGDLWGSNPERGVFRTKDGGETWEKVLYVDDHTGAIDLAMDPADPNTIFAAMYQRQRTGWGFNGGGPGKAGLNSPRASPQGTRGASASTFTARTGTSSTRSSRRIPGGRARASGAEAAVLARAGSSAPPTAARRGRRCRTRTRARCTTPRSA